MEGVRMASLNAVLHTLSGSTYSILFHPPFLFATYCFAIVSLLLPSNRTTCKGGSLEPPAIAAPIALVACGWVIVTWTCPARYSADGRPRVLLGCVNTDYRSRPVSLASFLFLLCVLPFSRDPVTPRQPSPYLYLFFLASSLTVIGLA
jgi:hypothetical protein